jgi:hypothetical protein
MSLDNVAQLLEDSGLGLQGKQIFTGSLPVDVKTGILLRQFGGPVDPYLPGIIAIRFQAVIRAAKYAASKALADRLVGLFPVVHKVVGDAYFYEICAEGQPMQFGKEISQFETFVVNLSAKWRSI